MKRLNRLGKAEIAPAEQLQAVNPSPIVVHIYDRYALLLGRSPCLTEIDCKLLINFDPEEDWNHRRTYVTTSFILQSNQ